MIPLYRVLANMHTFLDLTILICLNLYINLYINLTYIFVIHYYILITCTMHRVTNYKFNEDIITCIIIIFMKQTTLHLRNYKITLVT